MNSITTFQDLIRSMTQECSLTDQSCVIDHQNITTTLLAHNPTYNKDGDPITHDPNHKSGQLFCRTCSRCAIYNYNGITGKYNIISNERRFYNDM